MTDLLIRPLTLDDDFDAQLDLSERAFGPHTGEQRASWLVGVRARAEQGLTLGAFLDGVPVGAATIQDMRQYWLGRPVPLAGISGVKVQPEHQGRGIGRRLMTELLNLAADRGYLLSALYPATMPIYRSLGWELAGAKHRFTVPARSLRALVAPDALAGSEGAACDEVPIRRATPADAPTVIKVIGDSHRQARDAGAITWDEGSSTEWLSRPGLYAYLAGDDSFAAYRWVGGNLWVERVHARAPQTLRALWSIIASHCTTADTVSGYTDPGGPLWWLTVERDADITRRAMWMLRVIDASAAIAARGFPPGLSVSVPLQVNDKTRLGNSGRWQLRVSDGIGILIPNEGAASSSPLTLGARGLAALYAGTPVSSLRLAGLASGGTPDSDASLDAAFAATPYMLDSF